MLKKLLEDMKEAMKAGDKPRLSAIRMLRAAVKDKEIELGHGLDDVEATAVFSRLVKQRLDAAKQYTDAGREDLARGELAEVEVIRAYLPEPLAEHELKAIVDTAIAEIGADSLRDMGKVMAIVKDKAEGRADMGKVSALVKARLT